MEPYLIPRLYHLAGHHSASHSYRVKGDPSLSLPVASTTSLVLASAGRRQIVTSIAAGSTARVPRSLPHHTAPS